MRRFLLSAGLAAAMTSGATSPASALVVELSDVDSTITVGASTVTFSPTPATRIITGSGTGGGDFNPQGINSIRTDIEAAFNALDSTTAFTGTLVNVGECESGSSSGLTCSGFDTTGGSVGPGSFFNYLAIHFGLTEIVFYYATPINQFSISGLPQDISNFRAYSVVPLPAAAWLFISAIGGLFGWRRWQGRRAAGAVPA